MITQAKNLAKILVFQIDNQRYGLLAADVVEIERIVTLLPLPKAPNAIEGVVNYHGTLIPVLDIRARFGLPPKSIAHTEHLIIASAMQQLIAIRADSALELIDLDVEALEEVTRDRHYLLGVAKLSDGLVLIHNLQSFLNEEESSALKQALSDKNKSSAH